MSTKEARLEELDPAVDPAAGINGLLDAAVRSIAEGDQVTAETERLTGLEYRFFIQCVLLPQGHFAEFLHAPPRKRQELLVQLLDAKVYEEIRQRAAEKQARATAAAQSRQNQLNVLTGKDEAAELTARARVEELRSLTAEVRVDLDRFTRHDDEATRLKGDRTTARHALDILRAVSMPDKVPTLADDLRAADRESTRLASVRAELGTELTQAEDELTSLGDKAELQRSKEAHDDHRKCSLELATAESQLPTLEQSAMAAHKGVELVRTQLAEAERRLQRIRDEHAAADLARRVGVGDPCPVCLRPLTEPPHHAETAGLDLAGQAVVTLEQELGKRDSLQRRADVDVSKLEQKCAGLRDRLADLAARLQEHPDLHAIRHRLDDIASAEQRVREAKQDIRDTQADQDEATRRATGLRREADAARAELDRARDTVVPFGAPQVDRTDLGVAWTTLLTWRDHAVGARETAARTLDAQLADVEGERDEVWVTLRGLLRERHVHDAERARPGTVLALMATETANAQNALERVRENRRIAADLTQQIRADEQEARVAHELALRLRSNNFSRWLCAEALELLVAVASETLHELTDGQFQLTLGDKSDIQVIDYAEAGLQRSVRTLSGGETFQASLALALALSDQVAGLAATASRSLDSIFLDEGFGTLDPATLDTVATTLERLATSGERMVGVVTHVPALADRVPVRFEVSRDSAGSHLEKNTT